MFFAHLRNSLGNFDISDIEVTMELELDGLSDQQLATLRGIESQDWSIKSGRATRHRVFFKTREDLDREHEEEQERLADAA